MPLVKSLINFSIRTSCKLIPLGPHSSVHLREASAFLRLNMQCLYVAGTLTECPLRRGVVAYWRYPLTEVRIYF